MCFQVKSCTKHGRPHQSQRKETVALKVHRFPNPLRKKQTNKTKQNKGEKQRCKEEEGNERGYLHQDPQE